MERRVTLGYLQNSQLTENPAPWIARDFFFDGIGCYASFHSPRPGRALRNWRLEENDPTRLFASDTVKMRVRAKE